MFSSIYNDFTYIKIYLLNFCDQVYPYQYPLDDYLAGLPDDIETIEIWNRGLTEFPDLKRFHNVRVLLCECNLFTSLPELPPTLTELRCSNNQLTSLPTLPPKLQVLYCDHNQITSLPELPSRLGLLYCWKNRLTSLPKLPPSLKLISCEYNQIYTLRTIPDNLFVFYDNPIYDDILSGSVSYANLCTRLEILNKFRYVYYSLKCKKKLRDWLWVRVREPKIREKYHPRYLDKLDENADLDEILDQWIS